MRLTTTFISPLFNSYKFVHLYDVSLKADLHGTIFVACDLLTTRLRHLLGHDCRKVLEHVLKSYDFFRVVSVS